MTDADRTLEFEVEVAGTVDEVWRAIATGPGISSWYVPHTMEEREGGAATARFGPGPGMEIPGVVSVWEPPHRIKFESAAPEEGLAFEWLVEAREGGSCVVRLVNSGFGSGDDWDAQYDGMADGWPMFLRNLQLHLEHFNGQSATASLPGGMTSAAAADAFKALSDALGLADDLAVGDRFDLAPTSDLQLAGQIVNVAPNRLAVLLDQPAPGTGIIAAEGMGGQTGLSVWTYLYGADGADAVARDEPKWQEWLAGLFAD